MFLKQIFALEACAEVCNKMLLDTAVSTLLYGYNSTRALIGYWEGIIFLVMTWHYEFFLFIISG